jgi:hypothetical protein
MKFISKATLIALVGGLLAFGTGCGQKGLPPGKSPEDVIRDALLNQEQVTKSVFEMEMKADLEGEVDGEQNSLDGVVTMNGTSNEDENTMQLNLFVDGVMNEDSLKIDLELRANEDGVFANIANVEVSDEATQEMIDGFLKDYLDKWVKLSFMKQDELTEGGYADIDYQESDPLPFKNVEYVGTEDVLGVESFHFTAEVDEKQLLEMVETGDVADLEEFLDISEMSGDVYVGVNEMMLTGFGGTVNMEDPEMNGTMDFSFKMNPTKSNVVHTPEYEMEITEDDLAQLMFGGAMMGPGTGEQSQMQMQPQMELDEETLQQLEEMEQMEGMEGMEGIDMQTLPME